MTPRTAFLIVWGSILLGLAALVLLVVALRKLQAWVWARVAAELGLGVARSPRPFTEEEAGRNTLLRLVNNEAQGPVLRGQLDGLPVVVFTRHFVTKSGFHTSTEYADETVAAFRCFPGAAVEFLLQRRGEDELTGEVGRAEPSRNYKVSTQQPEAFRRLFTEEKLRSLEDLRWRWSLWADGEWLLVYQPRRTAGLRRLRGFVEQARVIAGAIAR